MTISSDALVSSDALAGQTLSPGFFDPVNDTSLEVTIPAKRDVGEEESVLARFASILFIFGSPRGCACGGAKRIEKIYSY